MEKLVYWIIGAEFTIIVLGLGFLWRTINSKIDSVDCKANKCFAKIDNLMSKEMCLLKEEKTDAAILNLHEKISDIKKQNAKDHDEIHGVLKSMSKDMKTISDCMTKLSANLPCD